MQVESGVLGEKGVQRRNKACLEERGELGKGCAGGRRGCWGGQDRAVTPRGFGVPLPTPPLRCAARRRPRPAGGAVRRALRRRGGVSGAAPRPPSSGRTTGLPREGGKVRGQGGRAGPILVGLPRAEGVAEGGAEGVAGRADGGAARGGAAEREEEVGEGLRGRGAPEPVPGAGPAPGGRGGRDLPGWSRPGPGPVPVLVPVLVPVPVPVPLTALP